MTATHSRRRRRRHPCRGAAARAHRARVCGSREEHADLVLLAGDLTTHGLPGAGGGARGCVPSARDPGRRGARKPRLPLRLRRRDLGGLSRGRRHRPRPGPRDPRDRRRRGRDRRYEGLRRRLPRRRDRRLRRARATPGLRRDDARGGGARARPRGDRRLPQDASSSSTTRRCTDTLVGEPETIWAFLGSGRLAGPIGMHRPDLVVHGHAHHGDGRGAIGEVPVHNVAVQVTGQDFASSSSERLPSRSTQLPRARARGRRASSARVCSRSASPARSTADG